MRFKVCTMLLLLFLLQPLALCQEAAPGATAGLSDDDLVKRTKEWTQIFAQRSRLIEELIAVVERKNISTTIGSPLNTAVRLLGELRAKEAVGALSNRLMYLPLYPSGGFEGGGGRVTQSYYVCAKALVDIGEPSIEPMLDKIRVAEDAGERDLAAWVIMSIEGKEQALHRLETLTAQEATRVTNYIDRYEQAWQFISDYEPDRRHPVRRKMDEEKAKQTSEAVGEPAELAPATK